VNYLYHYKIKPFFALLLINKFCQELIILVSKNSVSKRNNWSLGLEFPTNAHVLKAIGRWWNH
jgi:hypothetical protein